MIRVLVVDDSPIIAELLETILVSDPEISVVGTARNGREAVALVERLRPDVVTMDIRMPVMDGFRATEEILIARPTPVLVVSSSLASEDLNICFNAIKAGAIDVVEKPAGTLGADYRAVADELIRRVKTVSRIQPIRRYRRTAPSDSEEPRAAAVAFPSSPSKVPRAIAIGASTGGPQALASILRRLPAEFPCPLLVVQHIAKGFLPGFVEWLNGETPLRVVIGKAGERAVPGTVYFSEDRHIGVDAIGRILLRDSAPVDGHRPSATFLFESVAEAFGRDAVGVLLTGMGKDGAEGLRILRGRGAATIAQDEASCVVFGMPKAAIALDAASAILPLHDIPAELLRLAGARPVGLPATRTAEP